MSSLIISSCTPSAGRLVVRLAASPSAETVEGVHPSILRKNEKEWREIALFLAGYRSESRHEALTDSGQAQRRTLLGCAA